MTASDILIDSIIARFECREALLQQRSHNLLLAVEWDKP
jgi:hypothetical protein